MKAPVKRMTKEQRKVWKKKAIENTVWEQGSLLHFSVKLWTASVKVDHAKMTKRLPSKIRGMQGILQDTSQHDDVMHVYNRAHKFISSQTLDYPIKSLKFVDRDRIDYIDGKLKEFREEMKARAEVLQEVAKADQKAYKKALKEEGEKKGFDWQDFYDESRYPENIAERFDINWMFIQIGVGQAVSPELYKEQIEQHKAQWEEFNKLTFDVAKKVLLTKINSIAEGNNSVVALEGAIDKWNNLWSGYIGEKEFKAVIKELKKAAKGLTTERLRSNEDYKEEIKEQFTKMAKSLDDVDFKPKRAVKF